MPSFSVSQNIAASVWRYVTDRLPAELEPWANAMYAELEAVETPAMRLRWLCGCLWALVRLASWRTMRKSLSARPWPVTLIALYYLAFCCELVVVLASQLVTHKIHEPWKDAFFPVVFCFLLALLPGVIAVGLWLLDGAARIMGIFFAVLHLLLNWAWVSNPSLHNTLLPSFRMTLDVLVVVLLTRPALRKVFRQQRIELRLRD